MGLSPRTFALAVLCIAAQLAAGVHAVAVAHTRCAEHGEVVHGEAHDAPHEVITHAVIDDGDGAAASSEEAHEHCSALSLRRQAEPAFEIAAGLAPPIDVPGIAPASRAAIVVRALYRLAPKVSPPLAA